MPVPSQLPRWVTLPSEEGVHLARVEDVIAANLAAMFPGSDVAATAAFRITRDADVVLQDDEEIDDLLHAMEEVVLSRRRRDARAADDLGEARSAAAKMAGRLAEARTTRRSTRSTVRWRPRRLMELVNRPGSTI